MGGCTYPCRDLIHGVADSKCIPYKKPTVPQEPLAGSASNPYPAPSIDVPHTHTLQIEACHDRLDKHDTDIGALTLRLDNLEQQDGINIRLLKKHGDDLDRLESALKSLKEEVAAIPRPPKDCENYYEIDLGPGLQKIYISKNGVYPVSEQNGGKNP